MNESEKISFLLTAWGLACKLHPSVWYFGRELS